MEMTAQSSPAVYPRKGLRIRCEAGVHPEVRDACLRFGRWLRKQYEFPIRVVVYVKKAEQIRNLHTKELVSGTFFAPYDKDVEPYIRMATGDYLELVEECGKHDAICSILCTMAHELIHYYQWIDDALEDEDFAEKEAEESAEGMIYDYLDYLEEQGERIDS